MESYPIEIAPTAGLLHLACFSEVKNAAVLKVRLQDQDTPLAFGAVDANLIMDSFQLQLAASKALVDENSGRDKTHNRNSNIIYNLSPTTNIAGSLHQFGITDATTRLIALAIGGDPDKVLADMTGTIEGNMISFSNLPDEADYAALRKIFKIDPKTKERKDILNSIIGAMAMKSIQ